jgi:hypothetical protein
VLKKLVKQKIAARGTEIKEHKTLRWPSATTNTELVLGRILEAARRQIFEGTILDLNCVSAHRDGDRKGGPEATFVKLLGCSDPLTCSHDPRHRSILEPDVHAPGT